MPKKKLTDAAISRLKPPTAGQEDYWDALTPGFGIRISHGGSRTWLVQARILKNGAWKQTRITLGRYPTMTLAEAREAAREAQKDAQEGKDPRGRAKRDKAAMEEESCRTWKALAEEFLVKYKGRKKPLRESTRRDYRRALLGPDVQDWADRPIASITSEEILDRIEVVAERAPIHANRLLAYWGKFFNWLIGKRRIETNPVKGLEKPSPEQSRDRVLSNEEIPVVWQAFGATSPALADMFRLLLLTGQRQGEIAGLQWREVVDLNGNDARIELPAERTKNHTAHIVPLSPQAVEIICAQPRFTGGEYVFTTGSGKTHVKGFSKGKAKVDAAVSDTGVDLPQWRIHDVRRSVATGLQKLGVRLEVTEAVLNHVSGSRGGIIGVYQQHDWAVEKRDALVSWANHVDGLLGKSVGDNVIPMSKGH
jgi:integrase